MALKNDQYNKIIREYDAAQLRNKYELDCRREIAYKEIPILETLEKEIVSIAANCTRAAIMGDATAAKKLRAETEDLRLQEAELLDAYGFPKDYLKMHYDCNACKDTGFVENRKCHCFHQKAANLLYSDSNLQNVLERENFSNFSYQYYSENYIDESVLLSPRANMERVVSQCRDYIDSFPQNGDSLLIFGNTGVGKTFLCNCIAKELLDKGFTVIYLTAFRFFDILEKYKFRKDNDTNSISNENQFDYMLDCDLLIIDDLGTEFGNSFTTTQLYLCINERLLRQRSTIISTNLSLDNLSRNYSERIFSRFTHNYHLLKIVGEDIRLYKGVSENDK